ncbi:tetratricopeptide repeat protein [Longimicrobium sp.]|uniref:tetratricopeptide repeat protein n=1 Tax=Longimicrobium sp. TaxID=2029185 RepID=UPI002CA75541|nr:tetratricopeptide repeat protein [Longimicrobium sp.]HSU16834.1 tetratricopeptide repeat protein [Longimicrobium sp.]
MTGSTPDPQAALDRVAQAAPDAAALLALCSFLDVTRPIPVSALEAGAEALPRVPGAALHDPDARERLWDALLDAGAGGVAGGELVLNAGVARAAGERLDDEGRKTWSAAAAAVMERAFPADPVRPEERERCEGLLPHALAAAEHAAETGAGLAPAAQVLHLAGRFALEVRADYRGARRLLERAAELRRRAHGEGDVRVAWDLTYLNGALLNLGEWPTMAANAVRAAEILEAEHGPEDRTVITHANNAALLLMRADELDAARAWFRRALKRAQTVFGLGHPFTATILSNVGDLCLRVGDPSGAREAYVHALEIDERAYGPGHNSTARDQAKLGELLAGMGDPDAARPYLERAAAWFTETAGPDDARTKAITATLARINGIEGGEGGEGGESPG